LHHINVVAHGAARAVVLARTSFDGDGLRRTNGFAQLARDAAFFPVGVATQRMLATETRRIGHLLEGVVDGLLRREEVAHRQKERGHKLAKQQAVKDGKCAHYIAPPCQPQPVYCSTPATITTMISEIGR